MIPPVIAVHGGAGRLDRQKLSKEDLSAYRAGIRAALLAGSGVLDSGGAALDAVQAAVSVLEDNPIFNAGRGAVFTHEGVQEMDSCIMDGETHRVGAAAGLRRIRNPIRAARCIMERSPHVFLVGQGAEAFLFQNGFKAEDPAYFYSEKRWNELRRASELERLGLSEDTAPAPADRKFGTVGAVALDASGHLAAATSTGGMTNKRWGRVGDSPVPGAGTWADDRTCAVSCTGHGEFFIRWHAAGEVSSRMKYAGEPLETAAEGVIRELGALGGAGGLIAVDRMGNVVFPINTLGMYRGVKRTGENALTAVFSDDPLSSAEF